MALNFQGDRAVGVLNDPKNTFNTNDLFRVYDGGILVAGGVSVDHGDFVSWDGTEWKLETDIKIARSDEISNTNSSIAPNYTKKTYEANSYVMQGGVLYTNPNAIGTAEDWNPAHWTQTTVAEMMASAGNSGYTQVDLTFGINDTKTIPVGQKEDVSVDCTVKAADNLVIQLAADCTDAVIRLRRLNAVRFNSFSVKRGDNSVPTYGRQIVTDIVTHELIASNQILLTSNYEEGDHGSTVPALPTDFSEMELNSDSIVNDVNIKTVGYELTNANSADSWLFVVKGRNVICLPN